MKYNVAEVLIGDARKVVAELLQLDADNISHFAVMAQVEPGGLGMVTSLDCHSCETGFLAEAIMVISSYGHERDQAEH